MMLENMTKADSSKKRRIILNLQRHGSASAFRLRRRKRKMQQGSNRPDAQALP
jgi:hypothetical protein